MSTHYNLNTQTDLGGNNSSNIQIASQLAVKTYVDNAILNNKSVVWCNFVLNSGEDLSIGSATGTMDLTIQQIREYVQNEKRIICNFYGTYIPLTICDSNFCYFEVLTHIQDPLYEYHIEWSNNIWTITREQITKTIKFRNWI